MEKVLFSLVYRLLSSSEEKEERYDEPVIFDCSKNQFQIFGLW